MKKTLSILLVVCMLLTSCVFFSSCSNGTSKKDLEKKPYEALSEAFDTTLSNFFTDDAKINSIIEGALEKGSISINVENSEELEDYKIEKINQTFYMNKKDRKFVSDTLVTYDSQDLTARIFADKNGLALQSKSIFNTNTIYGIKLDTVKQKFESSAVADAFDLDDDEIVEIVKVVSNVYEDLVKADKKAANENVKALLSTLNPQISEEKVVNMAEKEVKCSVVTYTFSNSTLKAFLAKAIELFEMTDTELADDAEKKLKFYTEIYTCSVDATIAINKKSSEIVKISLDGSIKVKSADIKTPINATISFSDEKISLEGKLPLFGQSATVTADLTKETTKEDVTYKLTAKASANGESVDLIDASYTYTKKTGEFVLKTELGGIFDFGDEKAILKGSITSEKKTATITLKSFEYGDLELTADAKIVINEKAEMPENSSAVKDALELTEDEVSQIVDEMEDAPFADIFEELEDLFDDLF